MPSVKYGRSYRNFNQNEFETELKNIDWNTLFIAKNCDESYTIFYEKIERLLDEMAPVRRLTRKEVNLLSRPWITNGILKSIKDRDKNHHDYIKELDPTAKENLFQSYKIKRNLIETLIRQSKRDYYISFFEQNKSNVKKTWEGIRNIVNISKNNRVSPVQLTYKNEIVTNKTKMADFFNDFFVNIGNNVEKKIPKTKKVFTEFLGDPNLNSIFLSPVDNNEVNSMISKLNASKACGPNSIPCNIVKSNAKVLTYPIQIILNKSFEEGIFPTLLKQAEVCPIYKKNDKDMCENYRPISLLSNVSKLFERAMHTRLYTFFEKSEIFYDKQFGFRKSYSTNHALLSIIEGIREELNDKKFVCGVFIDLEKAFDTVNHQILLKKLVHYGVRGIANNWFSSYLHKRSQRVKLGDNSSGFLDINCGVPQGSILGPLLFLIYINDMRRAVNHSTIHHFADDTNLLCSEKDPLILRTKMNNDLRLIFEWLCANRLSLNVSKTEFIIFKPPKKKLNDRITLKLNGITIHESPKIKYLGIIMDDRLTWKHHVFELSKKLNKSTGVIYKMRRLCPQRVLLSIYYSLMHSHLNYGLCVWGNAIEEYLNKIRLTQKKIIRILNNADYDAHTDPLFANLKVLKLNDMYKLQIASLMWDHDHASLPKCFDSYFLKIKNVHSHDTRLACSGKLVQNIVPITSAQGKKMFRYTGPKVLNEIIDLSIFKECRSKQSFLRKYKLHLMKLYS